MSRSRQATSQQQSQGHGPTIVSWILGGRPYDKSSIDSQFTDEVEEELTVLDACVDCDDEALYEILQNGVTNEHVNERDKSGRVSICMIPGTSVFFLLILCNPYAGLRYGVDL